LFLRKLNEFFEHLPKKGEKPLKEDDLRAEHYSGFKNPGPFLSDQDEDELHKRVGHITLGSVGYGENVALESRFSTNLLAGGSKVALEPARAKQVG
jgi:hypothetical protein